MERYIRMIVGFYHEPNAGESHMGHFFVDHIENMTDGSTAERMTDEEVVLWCEEEFEEYEIFSYPVDEGALREGVEPYITNRTDMRSITQAQIRSEEE